MAVCFFNDDYDKSYDCEYIVNNCGIEVIVNYEIDEEIMPDSSGVRTFNKNTKFDDRDILIVDYQNNKNYLLKDAYYYGHTNVCGTPDGGTKTKFISKYYFYHKDYYELRKLKKIPRVDNIKIYSNLINDFIGFPSLFENNIDNEFIIKLQRETIKKNIEINNNNVKKIILSDDWNHVHNYKNNDISIKLMGYLELELQNSINYDYVDDYIRELIIYLQLLRPNKLVIDKIYVKVDKNYYGLNIPMKEPDYNNSLVFDSVSDGITSFLPKCYNLIPYRNSKNEIRNIPYIILNTSRNLEDNFLMFYRFVECYYKSRGHYIDFISYALTKNYKKDIIENNEKLTREIISLRNHYVHSGYFIDDETLEIIYPRINNKKNPKDYFEKNVDADWIYERTKILYDIVIDIIFLNMLNYDNYKFSKHF